MTDEESQLDRDFQEFLAGLLAAEQPQVDPTIEEWFDAVADDVIEVIKGWANDHDTEVNLSLTADQAAWLLNGIAAALRYDHVPDQSAALVQVVEGLLAQANEPALA